jgi:hypothetical protein
MTRRSAIAHHPSLTASPTDILACPVRACIGVSGDAVAAGHDQPGKLASVVVRRALISRALGSFVANEITVPHPQRHSARAGPEIAEAGTVDPPQAPGGSCQCHVNVAVICHLSKGRR